MKVSGSSGFLTRGGGGGGYDPAAHWQVTWNQGITAAGSSGSPLLDLNDRVIGQLHGGTSFCSTPNAPDWYGSFDLSWTGGGTNTTRLSNWLDPNNTGAITTNTTNISALAPPAVTGDFSTWCSYSNRIFTVATTANTTYTWSVNKKLNIISGQGTNQITVSPGYNGTGVLTLTRNRCGFVTTENVNIAVAASGIGGTIRQTGQANKQMNTVNFIKASTADVDLILPGSTSISCTRTSGSGSWYYNSSGKILTMNLSAGQSADFYMSGTGSCGAVSRTVSFTVSSGGYGYLVTPNPANDYVTVTAVKDESSPEGKTARNEDLSYEVSVYNVSQALITKSRNAKGQKQIKLNVGHIGTGVYFVVIKNGNNLSTKQLIIK